MEKKILIAVSTDTEKDREKERERERQNYLSDDLIDLISKIYENSRNRFMRATCS